MPMAETISDIIRPFRTADIAKSCGLSPTAVTAWRRGAVPGAQFVAPLAALTRRTPTQIVRAIAATYEKQQAAKEAV